MIDKIDGIGGPRRTQATREAQRTGKAAPVTGSGFVKHLDQGTESEGLSGAVGLGGIAGLQQIMSLQEVDDALTRKRRGKERGRDLLDRLEGIRLALLAGTIEKDQLLNLAQMVSQRRTDVADPKLAEILDEIELRARVELAKLGF
jgi:hypothetical protein